jgi:hypothetical protein
MEREKFHGRVRGAATPCAAAGCVEAGEFRAPAPYGSRSSANGPGDWQFLCLAHIRAFNARYDWFDGMSREEIEDAQMPFGGWDRESPSFRVDQPPRWSDFHDPLEAISGRFRSQLPKERADGKSLSPQDRKAMKVLGLDLDADRKALRTRYSALVRQYHPDRNGGDRSTEQKLQAVIEAYQHLRRSVVFV